jgi:hypothetical protein
LVPSIAITPTPTNPACLHNASTSPNRSANAASCLDAVVSADAYETPAPDELQASRALDASLSLSGRMRA